MKTIIAFGVSFLASAVLTAPTGETTYAAPPGGWESVDYPKGTGENLDHYPAPPGGWENVKYPPGTGATPDDKDDSDIDDEKYLFTSLYSVEATPDQVVNGTTATGGLPGTSATYRLLLNSARNFLCYDITLRNFRGNYQSPALTATHLHQAQRGASGPPRIVFKNPVAIGGDQNNRRSFGCVSGPFRTGVNDTATGADSGIGFEVSQIEANPSAFMVDVHSSLAVPGAVRGQLP